LVHLKQLGCQIVYASFHKILITTDKSTFEEAKSHIDFVTQTIKQKPLFAYITLNPVEYHKILLFKDLYNYGSIKESNPNIISAKWDISHHLPEATQ